MIPVLLHAPAGHATEDQRARSDKSAEAGDFGDLLNALADETGKPAPSLVPREGALTPGAPPDRGATAPGQPTSAKAEAEPPTLMERLAALLNPAEGTGKPASSDGTSRREAKAAPVEPVPVEADPRTEETGEAEAPREQRPAQPHMARSPLPLPLAAQMARADGSASQMPALTRDEPAAAQTDVSDEGISDALETVDAPPLAGGSLTTAGAEMMMAASTPAQALRAAPADDLARLIDPPMRGAVEVQPAIDASEPEATAIPLRILLRETHFAPVTTVEAAKTALATATPQGAPAFQLPEPSPSPSGPTTTPGPTFDMPRPGPQMDAGTSAPPALRASPAPVDREDEAAIEEGTATERMPASPRRAPEPSAAATSTSDASSSTLATAPAAGTPMLAAAGPAAPVFGTPAEQVGAAIQKAGTLPFSGENSFERAAGGPVRILEIQLNPLELGMVTVRLRTGRDGLEIRVQAARAETAQLLAQDRSALLASLTEQGHAPADLTITSISASAGLTGHDARGTSPTGWRAPDENAGGRQQHSGARRDEGQNQKPPQRDPHDGDPE